VLHHFLLIFPTGFKGVLATYHTPYSPHIFPTEFLEEMIPKMISEMIDRKVKEGLGGVLGIN
jgi:hypothetical protein